MRIAVPHTPLRELGAMPFNFDRPMFPASVRVPKVPLYLLGSMGAAPAGPALVSMAAPFAAIATTAGISSAAAGTAFGAAAGPIGAAVGALVGIIAGLWAAHDARAAGAKTENAAVSSAVQAFDGSLQAIFQAANAGTLDAPTAIAQCQSLMQLYWQHMAPYMSGPGRADASGGGSNCGTVNPSSPCSGMVGGHKCDKTCTVGCCVGCQDLTPTIWHAIEILTNGGSMTACPIAGDKYGLVARAGYSLSYSPSGASSLTAGLASLTSGNLLPLLLLAGAAFLVLQ